MPGDSSEGSDVGHEASGYGSGDSRKRVVVVGGGGHAKVCVDILRSMTQFDLVGYTDRGDRPGLGMTYLGDDSILPGLCGTTADAAFVAIGSNELRRAKIAEIRALGLELISAVSPFAIISADVEIGAGTAIMPGAIVNAAGRIGEGAIINTGATVDHDCNLGSCCHIAPGVNLAGNVTVGECALLGVGSCAIPGVNIGPSATVGAGAAVTSDVPAFVTVVGVPARAIKTGAATAG
jgi:UDP-perosamine 4-acetyltransferase